MINIQDIKTAMILAAGKGERMRPLTLTTPKPLLHIKNKPLIEYHIENLRAFGIERIVINLAYLGSQIEQALGKGERFGVQLIYSYEPEPLETGGAINHALELLGDEPFILVNGDIWLPQGFGFLPPRLSAKAILILVENPTHNSDGDFCIKKNGELSHKPMAVNPDNIKTLAQSVQTQDTYTFSGVSVMHSSLISNYPKRRKKFALKEVFDFAITHRHIQAMILDAPWVDVGTIERLALLNSDS